MTPQIETTGNIEPVAAENTAKLKSYYTVGVKENGDLEFHYGGDAIGMIELLGLHQYAGIRIKSSLDISNGTGDGLIVQLGNVLNGELEKVTAALKSIVKELNENGSEPEQPTTTEA